jgi:regulator of RNase E activity RraA
LSIDLELIRHLRAFDTPTICNALEVVQGGRLVKGFTRQTMICAFPDLKPVCGLARTATIKASAPSSLPPAEAKQLRQDYYRYVAAGDLPTVVVLEDIDERPGHGAFWGEVNTNIHHALGVQGCVTNGSIRDLDMIQPEFQLIAGSVGPSHAFVHVEAIKLDVEIFDMPVSHDDLIHADRHGAVIIPHDQAADIPAALDLCVRREEPILKAAKSQGFTVDMLVEAWGEAEDVH